MPQVFSLPESGPQTSQEAFRQAVKAAQSRRGNYLTAAEMIQAAELMGAPDPFPIGVPFSNQVPVPAPMTRKQIGDLNAKEAMNRKLAEREAGIRAYEAQTGPRGTAAERQAIFSNRVANLKEGRGIIPDKRAEYILQQRESESARNRALAAAQQYVQSQPTALMTLEDYRDPQGAFRRRMQERAFGLAQSRENREAADRADELGIRREALGVEREKIASGERLTKDAEQRKMDLFEMEQRINDKRLADAEGREEKTYQRRKGESDLEYDRRLAKEREVRKEEREADAKMTAEKLKQAQIEKLTEMEFEARATGNTQAAEWVRQQRAALAGGAGGSVPFGPSFSAPHPGLAAAIGETAKADNPLEWLQGIPASAADSPGEQQQIKDAMRAAFGEGTLAQLDKPAKGGLLERGGAALLRQNMLRLKVGMPPRKSNGQPIDDIRDLVALLPPDLPQETYQFMPWYLDLRAKRYGGSDQPQAPKPAPLLRRKR